jgi:inhibitor of cysteine peptidase
MKVSGKSQTFTVKLAANPTTGYQWTIKQYDKKVLKLVAQQYMAPVSRRIGAGGEMKFVFSRVKKSVAPQSTTIVFRYARSWEPGSASIKTVKVHFVR